MRSRVWTWVAVLLCLGVLLWWLAPVLSPFVTAAVLAYVLVPLTDRIDAVGKRVGGKWFPRWAAVSLVEALVLILGLAAMLWIVPVLVHRLPLLQAQIPILLDQFVHSVQAMLSEAGWHVKLDISALRVYIVEHLTANAAGSLGSVLSSLQIGGSVLLAVLGNVILIPVALYYFLLEWHPLVKKLLELVPTKVRAVVLDFAREADAVLGQYLRGQLMVMGVLAVYYSVGLALFGLDLALPIGVLTGLLVAVPYVGFGLGLFLATLAGLLEFSTQSGAPSVWWMIAVVYGTGQVFESLVLTPVWLGDRIGLHPLAVIFTLLTFGHVLGFVGVLIALPVSAVLQVLMTRLRSVYLRSALYRES
ncbi:AI-2E family transporter [Candidatus Symbiobacter mobilis]|nr:AI-2E family transporter [Candidatus Symbiobacter mobilis]